jgi:hypothetical protein
MSDLQQPLPSRVTDTHLLQLKNTVFQDMFKKAAAKQTRVALAAY